MYGLSDTAVASDL